MVKRRWAVISFGVGWLLLADAEHKERVQVIKTEHMDFPSGGLLTLKNSIGEVWVEGWDQPDVAITTIKSTKTEYDRSDREKAKKELDEVQVVAARQGEQLVLTTIFPRHSIFSPPLRGSPRFDLEYHINVPRHSRLVVAHDVGNVFVENLVGDIHVTVLQGIISLRLPEEGQYDIDARTKLGGVISDFPGHEQHRFLMVGHQFVNDASAGAPKLYLRVGYGDIIISSAFAPRVGKPSGRR